MTAYSDMSARQIAHAAQSGENTALEFAEQALHLAEHEGWVLNAFITICRDKALEQAQTIEALSSEEKAAKRLCGVPIAIKDNISYTGYPCTCGSRTLENYEPIYDATVVTRLIEAGAIIIGKTNMDEFAMGSSNETSYFGPCRNPLKHDLTPGGSSGGSAAAVAQGIVPIAYGSETGGSVRQPAAFCGLPGLKPTYGSVSRFGLVAFCSSTDQIGPIARNAEDLQLAFEVVRGLDHRDSTSINHDYSTDSDEYDSERRYRIGVPKECFAPGLDQDVENAVRATMSWLELQGHTLVDLSLPSLEHAVAVHYITANAEASTNLARYDGVRFGHRSEDAATLDEVYRLTRGEGFGAEVKRRIMIGTYVLSAGYYDAYYRKATDVRDSMRNEIARAFNEVDLLLTPTTPTPPFKLGEKLDDPLAMYLSDLYTIPATLTGIPAIAVPAGVAADGRPMSVQFQAPHFKESRLLNLARMLEGDH